MAWTEHDLDPRAGGARRGEHDGRFFRRQIRIGATVLLIVNLGVGLFARTQQHAIIDHAINIYDTAFISTNYLHRAQLLFQHYVDVRLDEAASANDEKANSGLDDVIDNLDVAAERADSPHSRDLINEVRTKIAALAANQPDAGDLKDELAAIQEQMQGLSSRAAGVGLKARDDIENSSARSDALLWVSTGISVAMVLAALFVLQRLLGQAQAAREDIRRRDAESAAALQQQNLAREQEFAAKAMQARQMSDVLDRFVREMIEPTEKLHAAAEDLNTNAANLSDMAQQAKTQSVTVAVVSEQTAAMVQSAARTGKELAQTIAEVETHAVESCRLAAGAVGEVSQTNATFNELAVVAREISEVTELINRIAGQTNLLALNATIEAARAGEAGRGFAVVAQEVKTLSNQSAVATQDISKRIEAIQNVTHRAVEAIQGISHRIRDLEGFSVRIASAVEQQTKAAQEIASDLAAASANVVNVNGAISQVENVGNRTAAAAGLLSSASISVTDQAKSIHERVRTFTDTVRAIQARA